MGLGLRVVPAARDHQLAVEFCARAPCAVSNKLQFKRFPQKEIRGFHGEFWNQIRGQFPTTDSGNNFESCQKDVLSHFWPIIGKGRPGGAQNDVSAKTSTHDVRCFL